MTSLAIRKRAWRAALVVAFWALAAMPVLLGHARCLFAAIVRYPCPGCGMTRAVWLLTRGDVAASLRMHALAVPAVLALTSLASASVWATLRLGSPFNLWSTRFGRAAILALALIQIGAILLWGVRAMGFLGGPVPL